jgi:septal ring factor EnvC (AmiA/AmiB activator)
MEDPTRPTRPLGQQPQTVAGQRVTVETTDEALIEEIRRVRFWSYFASAAAVAAAVLALIALIAALNRDETRNTDSSQLQGLRQDIGDLRSDITSLRSTNEDAGQQIESLSDRIGRLERSGRENAEVPDDLAQLRTDLEELTDRVDQIEQAQEEAASGGP